MTTHVYDHRSYPLSTFSRRSVLVTGIVSMLKTWAARARARRQYEELLNAPDHILNDIGVTRDHLRRELSKPFWRL